MPGHLYLEHTFTPCCICRNSRYTSLITKPVLFLNYLTKYWSSSELFKAICERFSVIYMQRLLRTLLNRFKLPEPNISFPRSTALTQGVRETAYCCPVVSWFTLKFTATVINKGNDFNLSHQKLLKTWQAKRKGPMHFNLLLEENGKARRFIWSSWTCDPHIEITGKQIVFQSALILLFLWRVQERKSNFYNESVVILPDLVTMENIPWVYLRSSFSSIVTSRMGGPLPGCSSMGTMLPSCKVQSYEQSVQSYYFCCACRCSQLLSEKLFLLCSHSVQLHSDHQTMDIRGDRLISTLFP